MWFFIIYYMNIELFWAMWSSFKTYEHFFSTTWTILTLHDYFVEPHKHYLFNYTNIFLNLVTIFFCTTRTIFFNLVNNFLNLVNISQTYMNICFIQDSKYFMLIF